MNSPTLSVHATQMGLILGTAAYMAPEQARGRAVDRRADIWAFGVVLFEMLTGRRAFEGDDISITLAAVLKDEVAWKALPADLPTPLRRLLRRCLEKDPRRRLSSIGDARLEMDDVSHTPAEDRVTAPAARVAVEAPPSRSIVPWSVAALATIVAAVAIAAWAPWRVIPDPPRAMFEIQTNSQADTGSHFALSPDGQHLVARVLEDSLWKLWVRPIARRDGSTLQGTDGAVLPFWSPDGRHLAFYADNKLKRVDLVGSVPRTLAEVQDRPAGGAWNRDDVILFTPLRNGSLFRVPATGGEPVQVTELEASRGETAHLHPRFLPDGVHFLYLVQSLKPENAGIYVGSLNSKMTKRLLASTDKPEFAAPDLVLFLRDSTLMAQRLDVDRLELAGEPYQLAEQVYSNSGVAGVTASQTGVLAYTSDASGGGRVLTWIDRSGKIEGTVGSPAFYENPRLSPDGKRLAFFRPEGGGDIWVNDLQRGSNTRLTFDPGADNIPVWSPDGRRIAFVSNRAGGVFNLYVKNAQGTGDDELVLETPNQKVLTDWSADGRHILYQEDDPKTKGDLWVLPLVGVRKPIRIVGTPFAERHGSFSPDGRWTAYASEEGGAVQVFVQPFPPTGARWQISTNRGSSPRWRPDGKELFYDRAGRMMVVDLAGTEPGGEFKPGAPQDLFRGLQEVGPHNYDVAPGGRRFMVVAGRDFANRTPTVSPPIIVVLNWMTGLNR